jgi:hypothetical protein
MLNLVPPAAAISPPAATIEIAWRCGAISLGDGMMGDWVGEFRAISGSSFDERDREYLLRHGILPMRIGHLVRGKSAPVCRIV